LNLTAPAWGGEEALKWVPLVSEKAAITAPADVLKRALPNGIDGGYLAVNPRNGDLYIEGHACLRSMDGGKRYALVSEDFGTGAYALCMDVHADGKKIAVFGWCDVPGSSGSGYSLDGGKTWESFAGFDDKTQKARGGITSGALEPGAGKTVLARGYSSQVKNLFYSADLGKTWTKLAKSREGVMGWGVFGPRDLVVSYWNHIERSEDAGATWSEVSKFGKCAGPVLHLGGAAYWLSDKGLIVSKDGGKTWAIQGAALPSPSRSDCWTGLLPGKDENHFVFLSKEGPMETLNGGKTWSLVASMPEDYAKTHLGISLGYDAAHDVFYMIAGGHGGLRPVKYARQGVAQARAEEPKTAELAAVTAFTAKDFPDPEDGKVAWMTGNQWSYGIVVHDKWVYAASVAEHILQFEREAKTGGLSFVAAFPLGHHDDEKGVGVNHLSIRRLADGSALLYLSFGSHHPHALLWYAIDARTGKLTAKGKQHPLKLDVGAITPDHKRYYGVLNDKTLVWCGFDKDGAPVEEGRMPSNEANHHGPMIVSPDGRHLYMLNSATQHLDAYGCDGKTGKCTFIATLDLQPVVKSGGLMPFSPDGRHLYVFSGNGGDPYCILERDKDKGTLRIASSGKGDPRFNGLGGPTWSRQDRFTFNAGGTGGAFLAIDGGHNPTFLGTFARDPATGALTVISSTNARKAGACRLALDPVSGDLFGVGPTISSYRTTLAAKPVEPK